MDEVESTYKTAPLIAPDKVITPTQIKPRRIVTLCFLLLLLIVGSLYYLYVQTGPTLNSENIYYMYTEECPNCQIVKQFMIENDFDYRLSLFNINITKLNMNNPLSLPYFKRASKECELSLTSVGVPFVYYNGTCFIGRIEVIDYLNRSINLI